MANHTEKQYTQWAREITRLPGVKCSVSASSVPHMLSIVRKGIEMLRLPACLAITKEEFAKYIPRFLHPQKTNINTLDKRLRLTKAFKNLDELFAILAEESEEILEPHEQVINNTLLHVQTLLKNPPLTLEAMNNLAAYGKNHLLLSIDDMTILRLGKIYEP